MTPSRNKPVYFVKAIAFAMLVIMIASYGCGGCGGTDRHNDKDTTGRGGSTPPPPPGGH